MSAGPLAGVRVLELGGLGPVPYCGMVLADLGAEVIQVRRPQAPGNLANSVLDRSRTSVVIDLRTADGVAAVCDLAREVDVVIEGFRPGVVERLGVGPEDLTGVNERLVYGRMSGFGQDGPFAHQPGHDINFIALSGALDAIGRHGEPPTIPLNLVADFGGGGMQLAVGVLAALLEARASGRGQVVDASMTEGATSLMAMSYGLRGQGTWVDRRGGNVYDGGAPFYDVYACADGGYMAVGAIEPHFYLALLEELGLHDVLDPREQRDRSQWAHAKKLIAEAFSRHTRDEWTQRFARRESCVTPVLSMAEAPHHPQAQARRSFVSPGGPVQPAPVPRFSRTPLAPPRPAPATGEHTARVLHDRTPATPRSNREDH
jgi:alpha-methylacyl-CoA racemase